jgi:hypothetical protein
MERVYSEEIYDGENSYCKGFIAGRARFVVVGKFGCPFSFVREFVVNYCRNRKKSP